MASAETLGEALLRLERYIQIANEGVSLKVGKARTIRATFSYAGIPRHADQHQMSAFILLVVRAARQLTGRTLAPTRVRVGHSVRGGAGIAETILNSRVEDGAEIDQIEFPAETWDFRIISADSYLHRSCVSALEEVLAKKRRVESSLKTTIQNEIAALMPHGQARHDIVAGRLGLSPRTLSRRLSDEGESFAEILTEMRSVLASRYIADRSMSISQIAWMLGYAELGTFTRAYQRWTGQAPSVARSQL
jgi:AraC-like DNA-binding protein